MTQFPDAYQTPGMRAADFTREAAITWGKEEQRVTMDAVIAAATVYNNGVSDETNLPGGLLMGGPVSGKIMQWDPTSTAGYEKFFGVLIHDQRMLDKTGTAVDRFLAPILVGGLAKPSEFYASGYANQGLNGKAVELAARAAMTQTGRFILDDEMFGSPFGGWVARRTETADFTVLESHNNTLFDTLGDVDAIVFTLPKPRFGLRFGFYTGAAQSLTIQGAEGTPFVCEANAAAASVGLTGTIGVFAEVIGISDSQYLVLMSDPTATVDTDAILGTDASLGITGMAGSTSAGGAIALTGGAGHGAGNAGGAISDTSGAGVAHTTVTGGASGAVTVTTGAAGTTETGTGGAGGAIDHTAAAGGAASGATGAGGAGGATTQTSGAGGAAAGTGAAAGGAGGPATVTAGAGGDAAGTSAAGAGGAASLVSGAGGAKTGAEAAAGGAGGAVAVTSGAGGATASAGANDAGQGGDITMTGGAAAAASAGTGSGGKGGGFIVACGIGGATVGGTAGVGGEIGMTCGAGAAEAIAKAGGVGGAVAVTAGAGGANSGGATGQAGGAGGAVTFTAGAGGTTDATGAHAGGAGGAISLVSGIGGTQTGAAQTGGAGGAVAITGAAGGATNIAAATGGAGATVTITAGAGGADGESGSGTGGAGGDIALVPGAGGTGNTAGLIGNIFNRGRVMFNTPTPETATDTASLTDAQMLSGILVCTPTAAATYTVRTGTQLEAALSASLANNDSFDLTIVNLGGAGDIITMAIADGVTFVGSLTIDDPATDDSFDSSGTFRFRRTAANTFVAYRLG